MLDSVKSHLFITRYCSECGMKTLGLEAYPRNVLLFLSCIEKMIADAGHADAWTREQREAFEQYRSCLYSHGYLDYSFLLYEALRQTEENPAVQDYLRRIRYLVVDEYPAMWACSTAPDIVYLSDAQIRFAKPYAASVLMDSL